AAEENISPEFLEQIFFKLKKAGIIQSVRGPGGGFILHREPSTITAREIFEAVDEGLDLTPCTAVNGCADEEPCERSSQCLVFNVWKEASDHILAYFGGITLQSILDKYPDRVEHLLS